jgi:predicted anti-sigma-YlaC factor YlaD
MKKCDHFKDLILTDYIDGELAKDAAVGVEDHLLDCSDCRAFFKEIKNNNILPLQQAAQQPVPVEIWDAVRQRIEYENQAKSTRADFIENLKGWFVLPKLVPVFASLVVMVLAGSATLSTMQVEQTKDRDQGEYLVSVLSPDGPSSLADSNDGATPIEHYFL